MEKAEMKIAPSTPTLSIAATISSPVTRSGQFGTLCQGRFGVFASYTWTWESMIVIGEAPLCDASLPITAGSCPEGPSTARCRCRRSSGIAPDGSVAGEAVVQEGGERQRQVQQIRELVGVERDQNRTQHRGEGTDQDGGVHHLVVAVDQLRQEQPKDQG